MIVRLSPLSQFQGALPHARARLIPEISRPSYPDEVLQYLKQSLGLVAGKSQVLDLASGTGGCSSFYPHFAFGASSKVLKILYHFFLFFPPPARHHQVK